MPSKKKSPPKSAPVTVEAIQKDIQKALDDARKKLKSAKRAKGENVDVKLKLIEQCKRIIDTIWPC